MKNYLTNFLLIGAMVLQLYCNCIPVVLSHQIRELDSDATSSILISADNLCKIVDLASADIDSDVVGPVVLDLDQDILEKNHFYLDYSSNNVQIATRVERTANPMGTTIFVCSVAIPAFAGERSTRAVAKSLSVSHLLRSQYNRPLLI